MLDPTPAPYPLNLPYYFTAPNYIVNQYKVPNPAIY